MGGDLTLREPPEIGEDQHLAVGRRELRESPYHVEGAQDLLDAVALAGNLLLVGDRSHDLSPPPPAPGDPTAPGARSAHASAARSPPPRRPRREPSPRRRPEPRPVPASSGDVRDQLYGCVLRGRPRSRNRPARDRSSPRCAIWRETRLAPDPRRAFGPLDTAVPFRRRCRRNGHTTPRAPARHRIQPPAASRS